MENQPPRVMYCVDTSSLVNVQRTYSLTVFPGVWESLGDLARGGRLVAPREVINELERGGDDEIYRWAKGHRFMFQDPTARQIEVATQIVNNPRFTGLFDIESETPDADPYVIALAAVRQAEKSMFLEQWIVVADESRVQPGKKPRIPDVCRDSQFKLDCIKILDMFKSEGWEFVKKGPTGRA